MRVFAGQICSRCLVNGCAGENSGTTSPEKRNGAVEEIGVLLPRNLRLRHQRNKTTPRCISSFTSNYRLQRRHTRGCSKLHNFVRWKELWARAGRGRVV